MIMRIFMGAVFLSHGGLTIAGELKDVRFGLNSFLGNIAYSELRHPDYVKSTSQDRTHYLDAVRDLGVTTIRETFMNWAEIEPERGKGYRFEAFDDLARKASERGIEIIALAYPFPCWATGAKPASSAFQSKPMFELPDQKYDADFRRFVHAVVVRYCGQRPESLPLKLPIRTWILSNEPDLAPPSTRNVSPDDYAFWLKAFHEEVKAADPGAKVVTAGLAHGKSDYMERVLASKNLEGPNYPYFDVVAFHSYLPASNATAALSRMDQCSAVQSGSLRKRKLIAEIWMTETGSVCFDSQSQVDANTIAVVHAASTGVSRVNLQGLWDIPGYAGGLLANSPSGQVPVRKPLFAAYQTLIRLIGQNQGVERLAPARYRVLLPDGKMVYFVWAEDSTKNKLDFLNGRVRVTDLQGSQQETNVGEVKLTSHPLFVEPLEKL